MDKVEALNAIDYQNDSDSFTLCVRCSWRTPVNPLPQVASQTTPWTRRRKRKRSPIRTWTKYRRLRTCLSWTTSSGFGWIVPSILRLWLLYGRHKFCILFWLERVPEPPGDPRLATARFWSATARYSTERILLGVGSHAYPPCKKGRLLAWCLVCHFHADF